MPGTSRAASLIRCTAPRIGHRMHRIRCPRCDARHSMQCTGGCRTLLDAVHRVGRHTVRTAGTSTRPDGPRMRAASSPAVTASVLILGLGPDRACEPTLPRRPPLTTIHLARPRSCSPLDQARVHPLTRAPPGACFPLTADVVKGKHTARTPARGGGLLRTSARQDCSCREQAGSGARDRRDRPGSSVRRGARQRAASGGPRA